MYIKPVQVGPSSHAIARGGGGGKPASQNAALQLIMSAVEVSTTSTKQAVAAAVSGRGSSINTHA
mgnify:CR=1|jgi:hypothetical protein